MTLPGGGGGVITADWLGEVDDSDEAVVVEDDDDGDDDDNDDNDVPGRLTACGECMNAKLAWHPDPILVVASAER